MTSETISAKHSFATRFAHIGLAIAVVVQLATSLAMEPVQPGHAGDALFSAHEYSGLAALAFTIGFWIAAAYRRRGADWGLLLPWFSGARLGALLADIRVHTRALSAFRFPRYQAKSPLALAVHGLGLLLMSAMAASGAIYFAINTGDPDAGGLVGLVMFVHTSLANLVWAYLVGHGALALIHHYTRGLDLREMWSLRRENGTANAR